MCLLEDTFTSFYSSCYQKNKNVYLVNNNVFDHHPVQIFNNRARRKER